MNTVTYLEIEIRNLRIQKLRKAEVWVGVEFGRVTPLLVLSEWPCSALCAYATHVPYMDDLTEDAVRQIEQIHSTWIECEVAGEGHRLMELCADDVELRPPDSEPVLGRAALSALLKRGSARVQRIEISGRRIRGSNEIAYLTASYKTTFSSAQGSAPRQAQGSHLWILQKRAST